MRLRKSLKQLLDSGIFEYFNIPYEVVKPSLLGIHDCEWSGGVIRISPRCTPGGITHEIAHFLVAPERYRFGDSGFYLLDEKRADSEENQTLLLAYLIMKHLWLYGGEPKLDYSLEDQLGLSLSEIKAPKSLCKRLRRDYNKLKHKGLLDTPYTRDFAPLLDAQLRLLSRGKLERFK